MTAEQNISRYLINRLMAHNVHHVFGVPGDYVLGVFNEFENSPIQMINTCDEQGAGFAADAYARINGLGVVCITYCVGGLKIANTTAQAYAEKSPVVIISGAPGTNERLKDPLLHHKVKDFDSQRKVFQELTIGSVTLDDTSTACQEIDRLIDLALRYKRPVYIEIPRDIAIEPIPQCDPVMSAKNISPPKVLTEALNEVREMIDLAEKPVILAGIELMRFGLDKQLVRIAEKLNIPVAETLLAKSVMNEDHPLCMGIYEGAMGREEVTTYVESSDCLIMLGTFMTDVNLGICTAKLERGRSIYATSESVAVRYHHYQGLIFEEFIDGLLEINIKPKQTKSIPSPPAPMHPKMNVGKKLSVEYVFQKINTFIEENMVIIADPGDAMFAAIDMIIPENAIFMSPAYYTSLGFAVPACMGVQTARPDLRAVALVGDGAFQMTGMELATIARFKMNPIIIILNNQGYGTERPMLDGAFNDVLQWEYHKIPELINNGKGFNVFTEDELNNALGSAKENIQNLTILNVHLDTKDISEALKRLTTTLGKRVS